VSKRDWSVRLLENLDINPEVMPPIQPSIKIAGNLGAEAAELLGLPPGLPVSTGAADTACSLLGAGVVRSETLLVSISTGGQLIRPIETPEIDRSGRTHTFCSALEPGSGQSSWYRMGATLSAGQSLRWLRDKIFALEGEDVYARLTAMAEQVPIGARGLIFLPYLSGERTPLMDPSARALFLGLSLAHGQPELVRAVMEGVTLSLYDAYCALADTDTSPKRIILAGGGARSRLWQQMVADVFGLPVWPLRVAEQSALGAAWLAGVGVGLFAVDSVSPGWAGLGTSIDPDPAHHERYLELLELFRRAYLKLRTG
jgi:xylulokinase